MATLLSAALLLAGNSQCMGGTNDDSSPMLAGDWVPADTRQIDFDRLPRVPSDHIVVSDVRDHDGVNQHNYLIYHEGRFWIMWSDGPGKEDRAGQVVKFATSPDGLHWTKPEFLTGYPPGTAPDSASYNKRVKEGFRYIARGFWLRNGELLALASLDEAAGFFGPSLALHAFRWNGSERKWRDIGVVAENTINNFPPQRLASGEWGMIRRPHDYSKAGVQFMVGGVAALNQWRSFPIVRQGESALRAEEPIWWSLPDGELVALIRDNGRGGFLYRAFSSDNGRTWSRPLRTNFPDATSKLHGLRLSDGRYVLVSNANPKRRDPLTLALSDDGRTFNKMFYLVGGRSVDYPHVMEHEGFLYVAHTGAKQSIEIERVRIAGLNKLRNEPEGTSPNTDKAPSTAASKKN